MRKANKYASTIQELRRHRLKLVQLRDKLDVNEERELIELYNQAIDGNVNLTKGILSNIERIIID